MLESTSRNSSQARVMRNGDDQDASAKADPPKDIPGPKRGGEHGHSGYEEALHAAPNTDSFVRQHRSASTAHALGITTRGSDDPPPPPEDITGTTRG